MTDGIVARLVCGNRSHGLGLCKCHRRGEPVGQTPESPPTGYVGTAQRKKESAANDPRSGNGDAFTFLGGVDRYVRYRRQLTHYSALASCVVILYSTRDWLGETRGYNLRPGWRMEQWLCIES